MFNLKLLLLIALTLALGISCSNTQENEATADTETEEMREAEGEAGEKEDEKKVLYDPFEESITSKVNGLKIVQDETRRVDSLSKGSRHLEYRVAKDRGRKHVYTVRVYEVTSKDTLDHFRFHVDSLTGNILNPDGRH